MRKLEVSFQCHIELGGKPGKQGAETFKVEAVQLELHAHKKQARVLVAVLVGVQDVRPTVVEHSRNARNKPLAVRAIDQKNG